MTVDFTKAELDLLDEALKTWAVEPRVAAFGGMMLGAMLRDRTDQSKEAFLADQKVEREKVEAEILARERKALLLRAKLVQALNRESEHTLETPGGQV
jgi:ribulose 1,5-bisphosphate synthetase/thiazole synthase